MAHKNIGIVHGNVHPRVQRHNSWLENKRGTTQRRKLKPLKCLFNFLADYCNQSSLHGLKYIVEPGTHWLKRCIWAILFTLSVIATVVVSLKLSGRFQEGQTSTVVESTNYPVAELPFPSVTLCPSNRVDWHKALEMEKDLVPTHNLEAVQTYRALVTTLSTITFGDFDKLKFLKNRSLEAFKGFSRNPTHESGSVEDKNKIHFQFRINMNLTYDIGLNLTNFLQNVAPTCSELLSHCWWRDSDRNCCEIFEPQGTEYGPCYSFNSETATRNEAIYSEELRPRRTSSNGDWTGIRFTVKMNRSMVPPRTDLGLGVITIIGHPRSWPNEGRSSAIGMMASITVQCPSSYATDRVLHLGKDKLPCHPNEEMNYNQDYCFTLCRQRHAIVRCGCNPSFMMPKDAARDCTVEDLVCLLEENGIMLHDHREPFSGHSHNEFGMNCNCPPECELYSYVHQITHTALSDSMVTDTIVVDVHFESSTMMRYRMDIVYTQLDLLVSFGGVAGLFLGGSILSLLELLYHLAIGLMNQVIRRSKAVGDPQIATNFKYAKSRNELERPIPTVHRVLPLMDYYPNSRINLRKY